MSQGKEGFSGISLSDRFNKLKLPVALASSLALAACSNATSTGDGPFPGEKVLREELRRDHAYQGRTIVDFTVVAKDDDTEVEYIIKDGLAVRVGYNPDSGLTYRDGSMEGTNIVARIPEGTTIHEAIKMYGDVDAFDCGQVTSSTDDRICYVFQTDTYTQEAPRNPYPSPTV